MVALVALATHHCLVVDEWSLLVRKNLHHVYRPDCNGTTPIVAVVALYLAESLRVADGINPSDLKMRLMAIVFEQIPYIAPTPELEYRTT